MFAPNVSPTQPRSNVRTPAGCGVNNQSAREARRSLHSRSSYFSCHRTGIRTNRDFCLLTITSAHSSALLHFSCLVLLGTVASSTKLKNQKVAENIMFGLCFQQVLIGVVAITFAEWASAAPAVAPAIKKATFNLDDIASAANGASRLRYGKRGGNRDESYSGIDPELFDTIVSLNNVGKRSDSTADAELFDNLHRFAEAGKRSNLVSDRLSRLAEALNGAERPRFG
uniref:RxLR effector protein n=1 Tax=Plectus sambesii TaxID=2011161 RepID=A0A914XBP9_9BILA